MDRIVKGHYLGKACVVLGHAVNPLEGDWSSRSTGDVLSVIRARGVVVPGRNYDNVPWWAVLGWHHQAWCMGRDLQGKCASDWG